MDETYKPNNPTDTNRGCAPAHDNQERKRSRSIDESQHVKDEEELNREERWKNPRNSLLEEETNPIPIPSHPHKICKVESDGIAPGKNPPVEENKNPCTTSDHSTATVIDIPTVLQLPPGTRIQVQWDVFHDEEFEQEEEQEQQPHETDPTLTLTRTCGRDTSMTLPHTRWWGATLLPLDGRTHTFIDDDDDDDEEEEETEGEEKIGQEQVETFTKHSQEQKQRILPRHEHTYPVKDQAIVTLRTLDYDPYPEGGFPNRSIEDVCFLTDHILYNVSSCTRAFWRLESDSHWEPSEEEGDEEIEHETILLHDDDTKDEIHRHTTAQDKEEDDNVSISSSSLQDAIRTVMDTILQATFEKSSFVDRMKGLPVSQQLLLAERIAETKEQFIQKMKEQVLMDPLNLNHDTQHDDNNMNHRDTNHMDHTRSHAQNTTSPTSVIVTAEHVKRCMEEMKRSIHPMYEK